MGELGEGKFVFRGEALEPRESGMVRGVSMEGGGLNNLIKLLIVYEILRSI